MKKNLNYITFLVVILIAGYFWQLSIPHNDANPAANPGDTVNVIFSFDNETTIQLKYPYSIVNPDNLFIITKKLSQQQGWAFNFERYETMGILITQIGAKANGEDQKYWQFTANELTPLVSVDNFYPQPNDTIEWVFEESEF